MKTFSLIGAPLGHSRSPRLHRLICARLGLDARYRLSALAPQEIAAYLQQSRCAGVAGINVTIPYKQAVIPYLSGLSPEAQAIGAVNTIKPTPEGFVGYNTDAYGFAKMLEYAGIRPAHRSAVILGSGGVARSAAYALKSMDCPVTIVSRDVSAARLAFAHTDVCDYDHIPPAYLLVNCTPVGMYPHADAAPIPPEMLSQFKAVADLIYNPRQTLLTRRAKQAGLMTADGLLMLIAQAVRAQEIWNDGSYAHIIPALYQNWEAPPHNLVLIGLPGCGKTTIGALLAREIGYDFADVDALIEQRYGPIPQLFQQGEDHFRACETAVVKSLRTLRHSVIACGGGTVERPYNMQILAQMGAILFLDRPVEDIIRQVDADSRPLLKGDPGQVRALDVRRRPLYLAYCHAVVAVIGDEGHTARQIAAMIQEEII